MSHIADCDLSVLGGIADVLRMGSDDVGKLLLEKLIEESERNNIWTLQAGVFPENASSLKIHEASGFRKIGLREKIGKMKGIWRDTVLLEKRSKAVGV